MTQGMDKGKAAMIRLRQAMVLAKHPAAGAFIDKPWPEDPAGRLLWLRELENVCNGHLAAAGSNEATEPWIAAAEKYRVEPLMCIAKSVVEGERLTRAGAGAGIAAGGQAAEKSDGKTADALIVRHGDTLLTIPGDAQEPPTFSWKQFSNAVTEMKGTRLTSEP